MKKALIFGITGQDGSYLSELLLQKGYEVHGVKRRSSSFNTERINHLYNDTHNETDFYLHYGDLADTSSIINILRKVSPDEVYNLAAQSHVKVSFEIPEYTSDIDAIGTLRILEAIRSLDLNTRFYQASSSEMYGDVLESPQTEKTGFNPQSPYAVAKVYAHFITKNYRESYKMFACSGILFNHESPRRGETFVTRKITMAVANIYTGRQECLYLGNLDAHRDWGHSKDYVKAMWMMLQQENPEDYVISTNETHSVRQFCEMAFNELDINISWEGEGLDEVGKDEDDNIIIRIDPNYFRPSEVVYLLGDSSKARDKLGWFPEISFKELVKDMVRFDLTNNN